MNPTRQAVHLAPLAGEAKRAPRPSASPPLVNGAASLGIVVGLFLLVDKGANDEKVIAVPTHDPYAEGVHDLADLPRHLLREVEHFFTVYKALEGSATESRGFRDADAARGVIRSSMQRYTAQFGTRLG